MQIIKYNDDESEKLYDLTIVSQLCRGDEEKVVEMVAVFTTEISKSVEEIKVAFNEQDISKIKKLVHKTKPTLTYYGTVKIEKVLLEIESILGEEFTIDELEVNIKKLESTTTTIVNYMKTEFNISNK